MWVKVNIATADVLSAPGPLPPELMGLQPAALADLSWVGEPLAAEFAGRGYWPVEPGLPLVGFDPAFHDLDGGAVLEIDVERHVVVRRPSYRERMP